MKLINKVLTGVALTAMTATAAQASTLEDVRAADELKCIVTTGLAGFAAPDANGRWEGFDADFCRGNIRNSVFLNTGNDGLDFSGSNVIVNSCDLIGIGDKGISSGEASTTSVDNCYVSSASMALVSKDQSLLTATNISIKDCPIQYASYQKKDEFGPGKIIVKDVSSSLLAKNLILDLGSSIEFSDTTIVGVHPVSIDSLYFHF